MALYETSRAAAALLRGKSIAESAETPPVVPFLPAIHALSKHNIISQMLYDAHCEQLLLYYRLGSNPFEVFYACRPVENNFTVCQHTLFSTTAGRFID